MQKKQQIANNSRILITGGTGLVGRALSKLLADLKYDNVISIGSKDCDLRDSEATEKLFHNIRPDYLFHLAARVHGIGGNLKYKSDVLFDNVMINTNTIEYARKCSVRKIVAMGSGCVFPELKGQKELFEDQIWLGPPHPSEDSYAHSKRLMLAHLLAAKEQYGLKSAFAISGNLYGPYDNFDVEEGHVTPSLIAKFFQAAENKLSVKVWGTGAAVRDFSFSYDAAQALYMMLLYAEGPINLGSGCRHSVSEIVSILEGITGVQVEWDASKPDGQLERYYNLDKLAATGFKAKFSLEEGVKKTYEWYSENWRTARNS